MTTHSLSYNLDEGMLKTINEEFDPERITRRFAEALDTGDRNKVDNAGREVFGNYGRELIRRSVELGEKHADATYEMLKKVMDSTGALYFPLVPQRFVEIAYLGVMSFLALKVVENSSQRLVYRLPQCDIYDNLKKITGAEAADLLPCRHGCLALLETLFHDLNITVKVGMEAAMPKEGYCQFAAAKV